MQQEQGAKSETEVTWEDQQNINKFGRLNNRFHELEDEIKIAKELNFGELEKHLVLISITWMGIGNITPWIGNASLRAFIRPGMRLVGLFGFVQIRFKETNDNLEDAGNELILTDDDVVRFQIGEVFAHVPREEVETRIEEMKEATSKNLEKLEEEKGSILAQMAELKKILYGKFKDSINLEED